MGGGADIEEEDGRRGGAKQEGLKEEQDGLERDYSQMNGEGDRGVESPRVFCILHQLVLLYCLSLSFGA
jgi:hypothetical protein